MFVYTLYCIVSTENTRQVEWVRSAHEVSLRYEEIGQIKNWYCYSERGEHKLSFEYKFGGHTWKLLKLYPTVHAYLFLYTLYCIFFPLRTQASWRSAKCTRRLFKVWRNWQNSKLICYSERGEPKLAFEYKVVGHTWKLQKLYPTVHAYMFVYTLYCIVSTENTGKLKECESAHEGSLRYEEIGQIQNWYVILKGETISYHLNINLSATLENL